MQSVQIKAYAKINLTLDVTGVSGGFHDIDSVVATVDLYDLIRITKRKDDQIKIEMHGLNSEYIPYESNNAVRSAKAFCQKYETCGVDITIYKNIPMGAGLGGSSADVAGVLNGMAKLFKIEDEDGIVAIANSLGSDCAYMLKGGFARMTGRGDKVEFIDEFLRLDLIILVPEDGVSTVACYKTYDTLGVKPHPSSVNAKKAVERGDIAELGKCMGNALYPAACVLNCDVKRAYEDLASFDPIGLSMTGSGSAVVGLFENDQFTQYVKNRYNGNCDLIITRTINVRKEQIWQKKD